MTPKLARRRAGYLLAALLLSLLTLALRLGYVQGVRSDEYVDIANRQRLRMIALPATRGAIYDRGGRELAISTPARTIYANPRQISDPERVAQVVAPVLGVPLEFLREQLNRPKGFVYLARRVDVEVARRLEQLHLVGIGVMDEPSRAYPGGGLAAHVLGFVGTDAEGLAGLEFAYQHLLGGRPGHRLLEQDPLGRQIPQGVFQEEAPVPGADLILTLDRDIQFAAERALARAVEENSAVGGTAIVSDPATGEILAMANMPLFNPTDLTGLDPETTRNRAVTDSYEPGSVNKLVTAAAALAEGIVAPQTPIAVPTQVTVGSRSFGDAVRRGARTMTFEEVIAQSSNVGTIRVALDLGPHRLNEYLDRFGYGRPTALGLPGEAVGSAPPADRWATSLPTMSMGQGLSATALQLTRAYATIANDGVMVEPKLVSGWVDATGSVHRTPRARSHRVVPADVARDLRAVLGKVVSEGTGTRAQVHGYAAGGKTGTAQKPSPTGGYRGHMALFIGFVPVEAPRIVVTVVVDEPATIWGGATAAPVFREVAESAVRILRVPPGAPAVQATEQDEDLSHAD